jgi:RHS repeat-associated protein
VAIVERVVSGGVPRNRTTWTVRGFNGELLRTYKDDSTTGSRVWTWEEDEIRRGSALLASVSASAGTRHYVLDHLGSPRVIANQSGTILGRQSFAPFGGGGTSDGGMLQFTGHERDAATLGNSTLPDYMHARFYNASWGRFLSVDPVLDLKQAMKNPQGWNRYTYVFNNPLRFTDPTGKYTCNGTKDQCKAFEASLSVVRAAANEATRTRQPGAAALNAIVALYGKAGVKNDVSVVVKATGIPGATGSAATVGGKTTVTVDTAYLNNVVTSGRGYVDLAKTAAHEGDHALQMLSNKSLQTSMSFKDVLFLEKSAWRTENYINSNLGISDSVAGGIWQVGVGWDPALLDATARANAAASCNGGCTP